MKTLLLDNYDSYTYNLFQLIAEVNGGTQTVLSALQGRKRRTALPTVRFRRCYTVEWLCPTCRGTHCVLQ